MKNKFSNVCTTNNILLLFGFIFILCNCKKPDIDQNDIRLRSFNIDGISNNIAPGQYFVNQKEKVTYKLTSPNSTKDMNAGVIAKIISTDADVLITDSTAKPISQLTDISGEFFVVSKTTGKKTISIQFYDINKKNIYSKNFEMEFKNADLSFYFPYFNKDLPKLPNTEGKVQFTVLSSTSQKVNTILKATGTSVNFGDKMKNLGGRVDNTTPNTQVLELKPISITPLSVEELKKYKDFLIKKGLLNAREFSDSANLVNVASGINALKYEVTYTTNNIGTTKLDYATTSALNATGVTASDSIIVTSAQFTLAVNSSSSFVNQKKDLSYTLTFTDEKILSNNVGFDVVMEGENLSKMAIDMYWISDSNRATDNTAKKISFKNIKAKDFVKNGNKYEYTRKVNYTLFDFLEQSIKFTAVANTTSTDQFSTTTKLKAITTDLTGSLSLGSTFGYKDENAKLFLLYTDKNTYDNNTNLNYSIKTSNDLSVLTNAYTGASSGNVLEGSVKAQEFTLVNGVYTKEISFKYNVKTKSQVDFTTNITTNTLESFQVKQSIMPSNLQGITFAVNPVSTLGFVDDVIDYNFNYNSTKVYTDNVKFRLRITASNPTVIFKNGNNTTTGTITTDWQPAQNFVNNNGNYSYTNSLLYNLPDKTAVTLTCDLETSAGDVFTTTKTVQAQDVIHNASVSVDNASVMPLNSGNLRLLLSYTNELIKTKGLTFNVSLNTNNNAKFKVKYNNVDYTYGQNLPAISADVFTFNNVTNRYEKEILLTYIPMDESSTIVTFGTKTSSDIDAKATTITITPQQTASGFNPLVFGVWQSKISVSNFNNEMFYDYNKIQISDANSLANYDLKISKTGLNGAISDFEFTQSSSSVSTFTNNAYNRNLALSNTQVFSFGIRSASPASAVGTHKITITAKRNYDGREFSKDTTITIGGAPVLTGYSISATTISAGSTGTSVAPNVDWQGSVGTFALSGAPAGVTINSNNGVINFDGTTSIGTYTMSVTATNTSGTSSAVTYTLNVTQVAISSFTYSTSSLTLSRTGASLTSVAPYINNVIQANSGAGNVTYSIASGAPTGVTINQNTGVLSFPNTIEVGNYTITINASNNYPSTKTTTYNLIVIDKPSGFSYSPAITYYNNAQVYSNTPSITTNNSNITGYSITMNDGSPSLFGVSVGSDGRVNIPAGITQIGTFLFKIIASNSAGSTTTTYTLDNSLNVKLQTYGTTNDAVGTNYTMTAMEANKNMFELDIASETNQLNYNQYKIKIEATGDAGHIALSEFKTYTSSGLTTLTLGQNYTLGTSYKRVPIIINPIQFSNTISNRTITNIKITITSPNGTQRSYTTGSLNTSYVPAIISNVNLSSSTTNFGNGSFSDAINGITINTTNLNNSKYFKVFINNNIQTYNAGIALGSEYKTLVIGNIDYGNFINSISLGVRTSVLTSTQETFNVPKSDWKSSCRYVRTIGYGVGDIYDVDINSGYDVYYKKLWTNDKIYYNTIMIKDNFDNIIYNNTISISVNNNYFTNDGQYKNTIITATNTYSGYTIQAIYSNFGVTCP